MSDRYNSIFRGPTPDYTGLGDAFAGTPIERTITESVADSYEVRPRILATAIECVEESIENIGIGVLFSAYDALPLEKDDRGFLYVVADADDLWHLVQERAEITDIGRQAVSEAYDEQVSKVVPSRSGETGLGFVISAPEFPARALEDIELLSNTSITNRQATVQALSHIGLDEIAIARVLSISRAVVEAELNAVKTTARSMQDAVEVLDVPKRGLSVLNLDPHSRRWLGLEWSDWYELSDRDQLLSRLPKHPGLYRVRHNRMEALCYVGESGANGGLRERVGLDLAAGLDETDGQRRSRHNATHSLREITETLEGKLEVSISTPPIAANKRHRRSIEAALVAAARRQTGQTPLVMLNRNPVREADSLGTLTNSSENGVGSSYAVPSWDSWRNVFDEYWMGLDWTDPRKLSRRTSIDTSRTYAYRTWGQEERSNSRTGKLTVVGTTEIPVSRLFDLQNKYDSDHFFSVAELSSLSDSTDEGEKQLREVKYDLIGAHYLATGSPPEDQY
jgi:hypothetical protein